MITLKIGTFLIVVLVSFGCGLLVNFASIVSSKLNKKDK